MLLLLLTTSLTVLFFVYGLRPIQRWRFRHIPGPRPAWMVGNLVEIVRMGKHEAFRHWAKMYGGVYKIMEGGVLSVVVDDPKLGRQVSLL